MESKEEKTCDDCISSQGKFCTVFKEDFSGNEDFARECEFFEEGK